MRIRAPSNLVKLLAALAAGGAPLTLGGCATVVHGPTQLVEIASIPSGAEVVIGDSAHGTTPLYARLRRGGRHTARLSLEGYAPREVRLDRRPDWVPWLGGNLLILGLFAPAGLAFDAVSGAMYRQAPDPVVAVLTANGVASVPADPATPAADAGRPARDGTGLAPGDTVRVTTGDAARLFELRAVRDDTLLVRDGDRVVGIPVAGVDGIERGTRVGRGGKLLTGGIVGFGIGAFTGALVGAMFTCTGTQSFLCSQDRSLPLKAAGVVGGVGAALGLAIGAVTPRGWEWTPVDPDGLTAGVAPAAGGVAVSMTWRP